MAFFPRFVQNDFAPMFRLMDDYANHVVSNRDMNNATDLLPSFANANTTLRSFQPRFDFSENKEAYELHGELPGVDQRDVEIEFTDAQTLSIRGRTESVREEGTRPAALQGQPKEQRKLERRDSHTSSGSGSYHKPTVEDEESASTATPVETPAETPAAEENGQVAEATAKTEGPKYWISERSVGSFARSFSFPQGVDQDAVKASLKNGVLTIVVPKAAPASRRINIE